MPVHIRLSRFEGPLEMLLSLIEDRKLDISQVSLAEVADQYLVRLSEERERIDLENLASFLLIASRLILLKSKTLLPILEFTEEEEEAAERIGARLLSGDRLFPRPKMLGAPDIHVPPKGLTAERLRRNFEDVLGAIPVREAMVEEAIEEIESLEERIFSLRESLRGRVEASFRELFDRTEDRMEVVVSFLAMLELVKQRFVSVRQEDVFGDIRITVTEVSERTVF